MRRFIAVAVAVVCAVVAVRLSNAPRVATAPGAPPPAATTPAPVAAPSSLSPAPSSSDNAAIARAFANHLRNVRVDGDGIVSRVLPDDNQGDRHQRFLVRLPSGESVLIVHNIDIAPRVENLRVGDEVRFDGEFVWNEKGGLVHWTHHDPSGRHTAGWIEHAGRTYR
jgi:uncharacterized protein DUF3465